MIEVPAEAPQGPPRLRVGIVGTGRVGAGALEVLDELGINRMETDEYHYYSGNKAVYTVLSSRHYYRKDGEKLWDEADFRANPENYQSDFVRFASCSDVLISCHYWNPAAPVLFEINDIRNPEFRISTISDVTCDIEGSIPTTIRSSSIESPFYDIRREDGTETKAFSSPDNITVCAVDNLPCELPFDASIAFGKMLMEHVIPELLSTSRPGMEGATICRDGALLPKFGYLQDFADQKDA